MHASSSFNNQSWKAITLIITVLTDCAVSESILIITTVINIATNEVYFIIFYTELLHMK